MINTSGDLKGQGMTFSKFVLLSLLASSCVPEGVYVGYFFALSAAASQKPPEC